MSRGPRRPEIVLVRHGETSWSASGRHTGRTDVALEPAGREAARRLAARLAQRTYAAVWSSPLARALDTAREAGFAQRVELVGDLVEWDYGAYEGRTTAEIRLERPGWTVWTDGCPGGETIAQVAARADRVVERARSLAGDALVFSHGHLSRVLAARWLGLGPEHGARFALSTASVSVLGWEREAAVLRLWNDADARV